MLSLIIPFHNEKGSLPVLTDRLLKTLRGLKQKFEIIYVDDGSTDGTVPGGKHEEVIVLTHPKRFGKGKALTTGLNKSKGSTIIFMDADLQDDPDDLPAFIDKIDEGFEFVNGWRAKRNDPVSKTLPSSIFNRILLDSLLHSPYHDINCGFKAMKREVLERNPLYGDNYRFLPFIAYEQGYKVAEVQVRHHPRLHGVSKYGFWRMLYGFFDTLTTYFIYRFAEKPLHFFGPIGLISLTIGLLITLFLGIERIFFGVELYKRPLLQLGMLLTIVGLQVILTGILAELVVYLNKHRRNP